LSDRQGSFVAYIQRLRNATNHDLSLVQQCKIQVCTALWGSGNPDISGMSVGYICSSILGAGLAVFYVLSIRPKMKKLALKLLSCFDDCATFFTFSIQIASIVVLARVDYGVSAASMGDVTVRTTWTVSALTLLPLMYSLLLAGLPQIGANTQFTKSAAEPFLSNNIRRDILFSICWVCSVYPTLSRMIESFADSVIGDKPSDILTTKEWRVLQDICLSQTSPPSVAEYRLMNAFGIMAPLLTSLFAVSKIVMAGLHRHHDHKLQRHHDLMKIVQQPLDYLRRLLLVCVPILSIGLIWSYFRLQSFQANITQALSTQNSDSEWGFGQVVSVVVFLPVIVEVFFSWHEQQEEPAGEHNLVQEPTEEAVESGLSCYISQDDIDEAPGEHTSAEKSLSNTATLLKWRQTM
ncbi:unnamed protein product, partial [Aureobasidium uvarum]